MLNTVTTCIFDLITHGTNHIHVVPHSIYIINCISYNYLKQTDIINVSGSSSKVSYFWQILI